MKHILKTLAMAISAIFLASTSQALNIISDAVPGELRNSKANNSNGYEGDDFVWHSRSPGQETCYKQSPKGNILVPAKFHKEFCPPLRVNISAEKADGEGVWKPHEIESISNSMKSAERCEVVFVQAPNVLAWAWIKEGKVESMAFNWGPDKKALEENGVVEDKIVKQLSKPVPKPNLYEFLSGEDTVEQYDDTTGKRTFIDRKTIGLETIIEMEALRAHEEDMQCGAPLVS